MIEFKEIGEAKVVWAGSHDDYLPPVDFIPRLSRV